MESENDSDILDSPRAQTEPEPPSPIQSSSSNCPSATATTAPPRPPRLIQLNLKDQIQKLQKDVGENSKNKKDFSRPVQKCRRKRSMIWNFIEKNKDNATCVNCKLCGKIIISCQNTTNAKRHLTEEHPKEWNKLLKKPEDGNSTSATESDSQAEQDESKKLLKPKASENCVNLNGPETAESMPTKNTKKKSAIVRFLKRKSKIQPYGKNNIKKLKLDEDLCRMIAEDYAPYSIVQHKGFRKYSARLDPRYHLPDRSTISKTLMPKLYTKVEGLLISRLKDSKYISLTFDGWTSKANVSFLAVTGHFIPSDSDEIESVLLCLINASDVCHSGVEYAKKINEHVIEKFQFVQNKVEIICCTTDNAGNMKITAAELKIKNMPCYAHTMQLVVNSVLFGRSTNEITIYKFDENDLVNFEDTDENTTLTVQYSVKEMIIKCKRIAAYFHQSAKANAMLKKECETRDLKFYRLVQCVITRWNSLYFMLLRISQCLDCINFVLVKLKSNISQLDDDEIAILNDVIKCLKPFSDATTELVGEKYVSMSLVILNINMLFEELRAIHNELTTPHGTVLLDDLLNSVEKRLSQYEERSCRFMENDDCIKKKKRERERAREHNILVST